MEKVITILGFVIIGLILITGCIDKQPGGQTG